MESPLILVIDDSQTIRKMVECHLSQAGYRVAMAPDAERGLEMARTLGPQIILLDHQLPGTTGDVICRQLLQSEATARVPVIIISALRNRAFAQYTEFPNVIDQIPKPFTPELLKSGVANALQMGALVVQAQRTGCAMPEAVGDAGETILEGLTSAFPVRAILDFLNNGQHTGRLTLEQGKDRIRFALAGGRIQAVIAPTIAPTRLEAYLPPDLSELAPLLTITLGEHQDASMAGLVKLLERSLADPRRLRALLRFQSGVLTLWALRGEPGEFAFDAHPALPPMFQALPLQTSLPALAVEGIRRCEPTAGTDPWRTRVYARQGPRGGNLDRTGLAPAEIKIHTLLDGQHDLEAVARATGLDLADVVNVVRGLELTDQVEARAAAAQAMILILEGDPATAGLIQRVLGPGGLGFPLKHVRDRVAAQLWLRRNPCALVILALDHAEHEAIYRALREQAPASTRFVGIRSIDEEGELARLDALGLDGALHRPVSEPDLRAIVNHLVKSNDLAKASCGG